MAPLLLAEGLLRQSLQHLHDCGAGRRECAVIWIGPRDQPDRVTRVLHPVHASERGGYQIDGLWLDMLWQNLALAGERIVAQVHTHPRAAFHSRTDDRYPIIFEPGLYSLVIPNFAVDPVDQQTWYLAQLQPDGSWRQETWQETPT